MADQKKSNRSALKKKIFNTVSDILRTHSLDRLTTDLITSKSGISRRALYSCFKTKDELISTLFLTFMQPYLDSETEIFESDWPVVEKLVSLAELTLRLSEELDRILSIMFRSLSVASKLPESKINEMARRSNKRLNAIFADGIRQKVLRDGVLQELTMLFFGIAGGICTRRSRQSPQNKPPIPKDAKLVVEMFLHGAAD